MKQPELGSKVLELRQRLGITQSELAENCNLSLRTIQRIEAQEVTPRTYTIKAIFSCLGYDMQDLSDDNPDKRSGMYDRLLDRIGRSFKYVKELFNLKTNTMKKLSILSVFAVLLFAGIFFAQTSLSAQSKKLKAVENSLVGIWQQAVVDPETGEVIRYLPYLKIFNSDGTYAHLSELYGKNFSFINASGKWKVTSEDTFIEYVELMYSQGLKNHTEEQTFSIEKRPDGVFMRSKFHTIGAEMGDIHETWRKCGFVTRAKAEKMWSGK